MVQSLDHIEESHAGTVVLEGESVGSDKVTRVVSCVTSVVLERDERVMKSSNHVKI